MKIPDFNSRILIRRLGGFAFMAVLAMIIWIKPSEAAMVYLTDGSRLKGTVVSATAGDIELYTGDGTIHISSNRILRIDYSESEPQPQESPAPPRRVYRRLPRPEPSEEVNMADLKQMFSIDLGIAAPVSRIGFSSGGAGSVTNGDSGLLLGAQYLYYPRPRLGTGLDFEYFHRSVNDSLNLLSNADATVSGNTLLILGVLRYELTDRGSTRPYILVGAGTNRTSTFVDATPLFGFSWADTNTDETRTLVDDSRWGFASTARIGLDFHFAEPALFSLELGWTGISNGHYQTTSAGSDLGSVTGHLDIINVAARWGWRF